jgi:hypothetical protein
VTAKSVKSNGKIDKYKIPKKEHGKPKSDGQRGEKFCLLHGNNPTHTSDQCHVLKKQADAMRRGYDNGKDNKSKNLTWKRKSDDKGNSNKELAAFVRKTARKELNAFSKKRKTQDSENKSASDKSTSSTGSVNNMEADVDFSKLDFTSARANDDDDSINTSDISV